MFKRYFFIYTLLFASLTAAVAIATFFSFADHEIKEELSRTENLIQSHINKEYKYLQSIATDWATRDDTYAFVQKKNYDFLQKNFDCGKTLIDLNIDGMLFFDESKKLLYARVVKEGQEKVVDAIPLDLQHPIQKDGLLLVASHLITDSNEKATPKGVLIVFKKLPYSFFTPVKVIGSANEPFDYNVEIQDRVVVFPLKIHIGQKSYLLKSQLPLPQDIYRLAIIFSLMWIIFLLALFSISYILYKKFIQDEDLYLQKVLLNFHKLIENPLQKLNFPPAPERFKEVAHIFEKLYERLTNEVLIEQFLDEVPFGVLVYQPQIVYANRYAQKLFGISLQELRKRDPLSFFIHNKDYFKQIYEKRLKGEKFIAQYRAKIAVANREYTVYATSQTILFRGKSAGLIVFVDITKEAELQQRFEKLLEVSPLVVYEVDVDTKEHKEILNYVSQSLKKYTGFEQTDITSSWWMENIHPQDKKEVLEKQKELFTNGSLEHTYRFKTKDGPYIWIKDRVYVIQKNDENVRLLGFWIDKTKEQVLSDLSLRVDEILKELPRFTTKEDILRFSCQELTKGKTFSHAWISQKNGIHIQPFIRCGVHQEYPDRITITTDTSEFSQGPTGKAYREEDFIGINQDTLHNEAMKPWRDEMLKREFFSSIALRIDDTYALNLYSSMRNIFTKDVVAVLRHLLQGLQSAFQNIESNYFNHITKLPNKNSLFHDLQNCHDNYLLVLVNIKDFSKFNLNFGFEFGDKLLQSIAHLLSSFLDENRGLYRVSADHFALIVKVSEKDDAIQLLDEIQKVAKSGIIVDEVTISVILNGGAVFDGGEEPKRVYRKCELAMFYGKRSNSFQIFQDWMEEHTKEYLHYEEVLLRLLNQKDFLLYYQPIYNLKSNRFETAEVLLRVPGEKGFYNPEKIVEVANELGYLQDLTRVILEKGIAEIAQMQNMLRFAFNVNVSDLLNKDFLPFLEDLLLRHQLGTDTIALELTEKDVIANYEVLKPVITRLKERGIAMEIDDFGVGHSNFKEVVHLDFQILKIDKSLIDGMIDDSKSREIVGFLILFSKEFHMQSLAEGVETHEQVDFLKKMGCDYAQGYYFAKPMPKERLVEFLKRNTDGS